MEGRRSRVFPLPTGSTAVLKTHRGYVPPLLVAVIGLLVYLPGLGSYVPLRHVDEAIYGNAARHMVEHGYWLIPHNTYPNPPDPTPFFEKPPLGMWFQAVSMDLLGVTVFALRLPAALMTLALALLAYRIGTYLYSWRTGFGSALMVLMLPTVYIPAHGGRSGDLDIPLVLFGSLFVWWVFRARDRSRFLFPAGIAAAAAVLTKGVAAGVFLFICAPLVVVRWRDYRNRDTLLGGVLAWGLILPWPIYAWSRYPSELLRGLIFRQMDRATRWGGNEAIFTFMDYPYFRFIFTDPQYYAPFVILAISYVGYQVLRAGWSGTSIEIFFLWWVFAPAITFAIAGGNHWWYVQPMILPLALFCGRIAAEISDSWNSINENRNWSFTLTGTRYVGLGVLVMALVFLIAYPTLFAIFPTQAMTDDTLTAQEELGTAFGGTPHDSVIYLEDEVFRSHDVFAFHANRPLAVLSENQLREDPDVEYVVVHAGALAELRREHDVITENGGVVAMKLGQPEDPE